MKIFFSVFYDPKDLGIRYLTSYLRNLGHEIHIVALKTLSDLPARTTIATEEDVKKCGMIRNGQIAFYTFNPITDRELELLTEEVRAFAPDVIGFGTRSKNFVHLPRIIPALRAGMPSAFMIAGGAGPTLEPNIPLELGVDAVVRGEGEYALEELFDALEKGKDWRKIRNVSYLDEKGNVIRNPMRPPQRDLDKFPFPTMELEKDVSIDNNQRYALVRKDDYAPISYSSNYRYFILGSRGCPAACSYCGGRYLHDEYAKDNILMPRIRQRSLDNILEELIQAKKKTPMRMVQFWDEFFIWPIHKLIKFFKQYKEHINVPFWAYISPDQLAQSQELVDTVVDAGLATFSVGLQTADEEFCKKVYNRINHNEHILYAAKEILKRDIPVQFLMIFGNPLQDEESLRKNWDFFAEFPFDPSFRKRVWLQCAKLFKPSYPSALFTSHPTLLEQGFPTVRFYYDAMLSSLRLILTDCQFEQVTNSKEYKEQPWLLGKVYLDSLENRHMEYLQAEINRLQDQQVYFWGCGTAYQARKHLLSATKPLCILNDFSWEKHDKVDGIEVCDPSTIELDTDKPLVIFARHEYVYTIYRTARYRYGFKDIVVAAHIS